MKPRLLNDSEKLLCPPGYYVRVTSFMTLGDSNKQGSETCRPLTVGLIGVTGYGESYYRAMQRLVREGRIRWGAVTIINPEEAPEQVDYLKSEGVPIYQDYLEMLDEEKDSLDWVGIPTGIGWHRKMTVDCLERGIQVLVEKPLAPTLQDVELIQEAEARTGLRVAVGFQHLYQDENRAIKRRLVAGEIGKVERIDCLGLWPRNLSYYTRNRWSGKLQDGHSWVLDSPLNNALAHMANLILYFAGDEVASRGNPDSITTELYRCKPIESFDTVRTELQFREGPKASLLLAHGCEHQIHPEIRITGTQGRIIWRFSNFHTLITEKGTETYLGMEHIPMREYMMDQVVGYFEGQEVSVCTTEQAAGVALWVNAVHDSTPIKEIGAKWKQHLQFPDGDSSVIIQDLEYYALKSFQEGKSLQQVGAPWAVEPQSMDLRDYQNFQARQFPDPKPPIP